MSLPYTNLYDRITRCYWFYFKIIQQIRMEICMNYPIRDCIAFTQNRTGRRGLPSLYISISIMRMYNTKSFSLCEGYMRYFIQRMEGLFYQIWYGYEP